MTDYSSAHDTVGKLFKHCLSTFQHSLRVGDELYRFASYLEMDNTKEIYIFGILHDIGKLEIPSTLLNKTTPLSIQEFQEIKRHTEYSQNIINKLGVLPSGYSDYAKYHHENIDGSGYYGLKDNDIPILSKMIRIIDSADTMFYGRTYQTSKSFHQVVNELRSLRSKHYDHHLVEKFIEYLTLDSKPLSGNLYLKQV